jgi:dihydrofolate reductase
MSSTRNSVFVGLSLDGFLARPSGDIDWLSGVPGEDTSEQTKDFAEFFNTVDVLVMGRGTFDKVITFDEWYYGDKPVVVLTNRPLEIPERLKKTVRVMNGTPQEICEKLSQEGAQHMYIDGGVTVQRFLSAGLIHQMVLCRLPVLIGEGLPLFGKLPHDVKLKLVSVRERAGGMVQSTYEVIPAQ